MCGYPCWPKRRSQAELVSLQEERKEMNKPVDTFRSFYLHVTDSYSLQNPVLHTLDRLNMPWLQSCVSSFRGPAAIIMMVGLKVASECNPVDEKELLCLWAMSIRAKTFSWKDHFLLSFSKRLGKNVTHAWISIFLATLKQPVQVKEKSERWRTRK